MRIPLQKIGAGFFLSSFLRGEEHVDFQIGAGVQINEFALDSLDDGLRRNSCVVNVNDFCASSVAQADPTAVNRLQKFSREGDDVSSIELAGEHVIIKDLDYIKGRIAFGVGAICRHSVVNIQNRDNLAEVADFFAFEVGRITGAVATFVVVQDAEQNVF